MLTYSLLADSYAAIGKSASIKAKWLAILTKTDGWDHPNTVDDMLNFQRKPWKSPILQRKDALARYKQLFGDAHPWTLICMASLALDYCVVGKYTKALSLQEEVLRMNEKQMGSDHPSTVRARKVAAWTRRLIAYRKIFHFWIPKKRN